MNTSIISFSHSPQIKRYSDLRAEGDTILKERMTVLVVHRDAVLATMRKWHDNLDYLDEKIAFYKSEIEGNTALRSEIAEPMASRHSEPIE